MTLPNHVADYLENHADGNGLITDAVHQRMAQTMTTGEMLDAVGFRSTEKTRAWAREALSRARPTDEQRAENQRRQELIRAGLWPDQQ